MCVINISHQQHNSNMLSKIKRLPYPKSLYQITRRPEGSSNCDYLSRNGPQDSDAPGFPSGHMTTIGFFAAYQILSQENPTNYYIMQFLNF